MDLRIPTSFARFSERAVLRFMKLMHASSNTNTPVMPIIQTSSTRPPTFLPSSKSEYRCHLLIGCRDTSGLDLRRLSVRSLLYFTFTIFAETCSTSAFFSSCTHVCVKLLSHGSSMVL